MTAPRFEVVRTTTTPQPWHARFVAANGRITWVTETYSRRRGALNAVTSLLDPLVGTVEVRDVDERSKP